MSDRTDKLALKAFSEVMHQELHQRLRKRVRLRSKLKLTNSWTKGWRVQLAGIGKGQPRLELYFCHWADPRKRRLWYGLYSAQPKELRTLVKRLPSYMMPKRKFT